jgi:ribA/ribD-fused uncharacterized protein
MKIEFYMPNDDFGFLANFSEHPIVINGITWRTVEHYYQAQKFTIPKIQHKIKFSNTPGEAKSIAHRYKIIRINNWFIIKESIMYRAIKAKFQQHPELLKELLNTKDAILIENSPDDLYWGIGSNNLGLNRMGVLLMELRNELANIPNEVKYV